MKRKDYVLIAEALRNHIMDCEDTWVLDHAVEALADALQADNPKGFDREMFLKNAGVTPP